MVRGVIAVVAPVSLARHIYPIQYDAQNSGAHVLKTGLSPVLVDLMDRGFVSAIATNGAGLYEFTERAASFVREARIGTGLLTLFVRHTSCSLIIQENADPDVRRDLEAFFRRIVPNADDPSMGYIVHRSEGPDDMPAHIRSA